MDAATDESPSVSIGGSFVSTSDGIGAAFGVLDAATAAAAFGVLDAAAATAFGVLDAAAAFGVLDVATAAAFGGLEYVAAHVGVFGTLLLSFV